MSMMKIIYIKAGKIPISRLRLKFGVLRMVRVRGRGVVSVELHRRDRYQLEELLRPGPVPGNEMGLVRSVGSGMPIHN